MHAKSFMDNAEISSGMNGTELNTASKWPEITYFSIQDHFRRSE